MLGSSVTGSAEETWKMNTAKREERKDTQSRPCGKGEEAAAERNGDVSCWQQQYLRVLELCLALGKAPCLRDGAKRPVVFCDFMGHTGSFFVSVFLEGWRPDAKEDVACTYKNGKPVAGCELDRLIGFLEELAEKWT